MNKFTRKFILLAVALVTVLSMASGIQSAKAQKTVITWFVGLGSGTQAEQLDAQNKVVADFNASQDKIELKINIAASNQAANDTLSTLIASGNVPDIVGPVGFTGANAFNGQWADFKPLVAKAKFDLKQFPDALVKLYEDNGALVGIPFATFPGVLFYNADLFDEAGLAYPPAKYGEKYKWDGKDVDWDYDTLAAVAKKLTIDAAGEDATSAKFDPTKIEQFGFIHQYDSIRSDLSTFGGSAVAGPDGKVKLSDAWRAEAKWLWSGIWKDHFIPSNTYISSDLLKPSGFASGHIAMARVMLWYTCCVADLKAKWDFGVQPSYKGTTYAPADADTFRIMKDSKNQQAAFTVLQYFFGPAALDLLKVYGAFPARPDLQDSFIKALSEKYPSVKNWDIIAPSFAYAVAPGHESSFPNYNKGQQRFADFATLLYGDAGKDIDVDKAFDELQSDLQAIVSAGDPPIVAPTMEATK